MTATVALIAFVVGMLAAAVILRGVQARLPDKPTYGDWQSAPLLGGGGLGTLLLMLFSALAAIVGFIGFGLPGEVRGALLGWLFGFCAPFFFYGLFLRVARNRPATASASR